QIKIAGACSVGHLSRSTTRQRDIRLSAIRWGPRVYGCAADSCQVFIGRPQDDSASNGDHLAGRRGLLAIARPRLHKSAPLDEQVGGLIGAFDSAANRVA